MHIILHILIQAFKWKGKGIFVVPVIAGSCLLVFGMGHLSLSLTKAQNTEHTNIAFLGIAFLVAGYIIPKVTRNYTIDENGEPEYFEEEGMYSSIPVSDWTKMLYFFGALMMIATIAEYYL